MKKASDPRNKKPAAHSRLDETDRKLLTLLARDSTMSYAALGLILHLSAPAVHERAKRLKQDGIIKNTIAVIDGAKVGRPLLGFILVDTKSWAVACQLLKLKEIPAVEEIHSVSGENAMLLKVRTCDTQALDALLQTIHELEGITGTRSYVALSTYLERGPSPLEE